MALSRHADRQALTKAFGATDMVAERGDDAVTAVLSLTDGAGVGAALECVGTDQYIETVPHPGHVLQEVLAETHRVVLRRADHTARRHDQPEADRTRPDAAEHGRPPPQAPSPPSLRSPPRRRCPGRYRP
ncbi:hypothetical protein [Streptomyces sp. NPDC094471]|uniref:hypothetical protein n=1 Tax=Streptomyces sp. NPDC094471 TaxID=3155209 RepID=UPI003319358D